MRSSFLLALSLLFFNVYTNASHPTVPVTDRTLNGHAAVLDPVQVEGLTLIPIVETIPSAADETLVLDEAMQARLVTIREVPGGRVNELELQNHADKPLFLLAGEVILGGKQDRIIASNIVIPPNTTEVVPVFCVERGRWDGSATDFTTAEALAHTRLRGTANYAAQHDVWAEVTRANELRNTTSSTDTYRTLAIERHASWESRIRAALDEGSVADNVRMIGFAVAFEGELVTVDLFDSPILFAKLERKLIRSYIAEAIASGYGDHAASVRAPCVHAIRDFMANADRGTVERAHETQLSATLVRRGDRAATTSVQLKRDHGRHVYSNYLGNAPQQPPCHVYAGYIGNNPGCRNPYPSSPGRLRRTRDHFE